MSLRQPWRVVCCGLILLGGASALQGNLPALVSDALHIQDRRDTVGRRAYAPPLYQSQLSSADEDHVWRQEQLAAMLDAAIRSERRVALQREDSMYGRAQEAGTPRGGSIFSERPSPAEGDKIWRREQQMGTLDQGVAERPWVASPPVAFPQEQHGGTSELAHMQVEEAEYLAENEAMKLQLGVLEDTVKRGTVHVTQAENALMSAGNRASGVENQAVDKSHVETFRVVSLDGNRASGHGREIGIFAVSVVAIVGLLFFCAGAKDSKEEIEEHIQQDHDEAQLWTEIQHQKDSGGKFVFFDHIYIDEDGGFDEVHQMFDRLTIMSLVGPALGVLFLFYNSEYVIAADYKAISTPNPEMNEMWTLTGALIGPLLTMAKGSKVGVAGVRVVAGLEISSLLVLWGLFLSYLFIGLTTRGRLRWKACCDICWWLIPYMGSFSAMGLLYFISPYVLVDDLSQLMTRMADLADDAGAEQQSGMQQKIKLVKALAKFWSFRLVCLVIGFDAFLAKYRVASEFINSSEVSVDNMMASLVFVNQLLGIMQVALLIRRRLFVFVFGGADGILENKEQARQVVYNAMLAQYIFKFSQGLGGPVRSRFFVVMMNYTDMDFQTMVLNEKTKDKELQEPGAPAPQPPSSNLPPADDLRQPLQGRREMETF